MEKRDVFVEVLGCAHDGHAVSRDDEDRLYSLASRADAHARVVGLGQLARAVHRVVARGQERGIGVVGGDDLVAALPGDAVHQPRLDPAAAGPELVALGDGEDQFSWYSKVLLAWLKLTISLWLTPAWKFCRCMT